MKILLLPIFTAMCLTAESRTEKQLRAQLADATEKLHRAQQSWAKDKTTANEANVSLARNYAKAQTQIRELSAKIDALSAERDVLKTSVQGQAEITKFQSKVIAASRTIPEVPVRDAPKIEKKLDAQQVVNIAAFDRNARIILEGQKEVRGEMSELRRLTKEVAKAQIDDHQELLRHRGLLERQNLTDSRLLWLTYFVGGMFVLMTGALIYYLRYVHE